MLQDFQNETLDANNILDHYNYVKLEGETQGNGAVKLIQDEELGENVVMAKRIFNKLTNTIRRLSPLINIFKNDTKSMLPFLTKKLLTHIYPPATAAIEHLPNAIQFIKKIVKFRTNT